VRGALACPAGHPTPSRHRLGPGLPEYLIPFAPLAFAPQRQGRPSWPPSPPVFYPISTHFTATPGVPPAPTALVSAPVSAALSRVSRELSPPTQGAAYARFTPSDSGQRSHPTYYRGCWHVVSRCFFPGYRPASPPGKAVYTPRGVVPHAASLDQACAHCQNSLTAASRRSLGRVSVPVWLAVLSDQLRITALVGRHPAN